MKLYRILLTAVFLAGLAVPAFADWTDELNQAFNEGKAYFDLRYRYEHVEQDGKTDDADASTLRSRFGFSTGEFRNFKAVIEGENVAEIGDDDYNNTINGKTTYPTVADVESMEVNQAYVVFTGIKDNEFKAGRQVMTIDNHRFIGHVGWRQNNQTYDGLMIKNTFFPHTTLKYGYIGNVNRIFGEESTVGDFDSKSHIIHLSNTGTPLGTISTYGFVIDLENDSPANSNQTWGVSLVGSQDLNEEVKFKYRAEFAYQNDYGDNTSDYEAKYWHLAPALNFKGLTATFGYEVLGSEEGNFGFRTPLATLHKFNGWADQFLTTPKDGLEDIYVDLTYKVSGLEGSWEFFNGLLGKFQYHDFSAADGNVDYGTEWGIYLKQPLVKNTYIEFKYADYDADGLNSDIEKTTVGVGVKY